MNHNLIHWLEEEEFECHKDDKFRMFHFTKHTGKEVLDEELRNPRSILY